MNLEHLPSIVNTGDGRVRGCTVHGAHGRGRREQPTRTASRRTTVRHPVSRAISKRLYRHISQSVCPWNVKFSPELAEDSPFRARPFLDGKEAVTLATDILALEQEQFSAAFGNSPMKRAKLAGLRRNALVVLTNTEPPLRVSSLPSADIERQDTSRL